MESHRYQFAARDLLRTTLLPLLGAGFLLAAVRLADALALLPPIKPADDPDQTLLVWKSDLSRARDPARILLVGDSSCAAGIDAPQLGRLLPGQPRVLNLGLIIGLGLDACSDALVDFTAANPNQVHVVALLVTPQLLSNQDHSPVHQEFWRQLRQGEMPRAHPVSWRRSALASVELLKQRIVPRLLHVPLRGRAADFYGFSSGFQAYLEAHQGSMIDPRTFSPPRRVTPEVYHLSPALQEPSRRLRQGLPRGVKLAIGLTPIPQSLASPNFSRQRDALLAEWGRWLDADCLLTNSPAQLPDDLFATGGHLNAAGQRLYTRLLAADLAQGTRP